MGGPAVLIRGDAATDAVLRSLVLTEPNLLGAFFLVSRNFGAYEHRLAR